MHLWAIHIFLNVVEKPLKLETKVFEDRMCLQGDRVEMEFGNRLCRQSERGSQVEHFYIDRLYIFGQIYLTQKDKRTNTITLQPFFWNRLISH